MSQYKAHRSGELLLQLEVLKRKEPPGEEKNNLKCSCLVVVVQQYLNILIRSTACSALLRPKVKRQLRPRGAQDMMEQMGEEVSRCVRRSRRVQPRQKKKHGMAPDPSAPKHQLQG